MFSTVYRRLVLLNVALVAGTVIVVVVAIYLLLQASLQREADQALSERIRGVESIWAAPLASDIALVTPVSESVQRDDDDEGDEDDDAHELLETGDTLIFVFDRDGQLVGNERQVNSDLIPIPDAVTIALAGELDVRTMRLDDEIIRVQTAPVQVDDQVVGAIQAVRSDREHLAELGLVRNVGIAGLILGVAVAFPTGLFLSRRAVQPLSLALERQRLFVADASHELKTPLSVMRANVELIARESDMTLSERRAELGHVLAEIDDMAGMVNSLLLLAKLDASARESNDRVQALGIVREVVREMLPLANAAGLTLTVDGDDVEVVADEASLRQVIRILIDNAIAYSPGGGTVEVRVLEHMHVAVIQVRDTGSGIPEEDRLLVFDRFFRSEHTRYLHAGGTGLGLSIALATVTALGGTMDLESAVGRGTTVIVTLPRAR